MPYKVQNARTEVVNKKKEMGAKGEKRARLDKYFIDRDSPRLST